MKKECLTDKQKRFAEEYLVDLNATRAAIRAGYSEKSASNAYRMLQNKTINDAVIAAMAERSARTGVSADRVVAELAKIGFANITDVTGDGADRDDTAAVHFIKERRIPSKDGEIVEREVKLYDKIRALEQLGRHLGIFNDKFRLEGGVRVVINDDL